MHEIQQTELWEKFENHLLNESLTKKRVNKLKTMFAMVERGLGSFKKAKREDIEEFITRVQRGTFRKENGKVYSGSTKCDIKRFLKQFWKWYKGDNEGYPKEVSWIKARIGKDERPKEKDVLTQAEIAKVVQHFRRPDFRLMTLLLFDSGFRIGEMFSVTKERLTWEPFDEEGSRVWWIECTESKTIPRKVDVGLFTEEVTTYTRTVDFTKLKPTDRLFRFSDTLFRAALAQAVKAAGIKKKITAHNLRHSSATLYAGIYKGDRVRLAERYGWSYTASELDTYVRRNSQGAKESAKVVYKDRVLELTREVAELKADMAEMRKSLEGFESKLWAEFRHKAKAATVTK